jgi:hypothetical protein
MAFSNDSMYQYNGYPPVAAQKASVLSISEVRPLYRVATYRSRVKTNPPDRC